MSKFLNRADWTFPIPIRYGPGRIQELGTVCLENGVKAPLIVTDQGSLDLPFITEALESISNSGFKEVVFSQVAQNPSAENIMAGRDTFIEGGHDAVIAIGGGSGMDAGKAISLVANYKGDLWDFDYDKPLPDLGGTSSFPTLICIPTTAGTGAETESTAMVTDTTKGVKRCVWHPNQKPVTAILDPKLTIGLPQNITAWTGCDALVHAIEALSVPELHPICDGLALESIRLIFRNLPDVVKNGDNLESRGAMLVASCLAGIAFLKGLGLVHAMSHMVGAVCNTHHGLTNAVLLPLVLRYNEKGLGNKTSLICQSIGLKSNTFDHLYNTVTSLLDELEIPSDLAALNVRQDQIAEIAQKAFTDTAITTNPVPITVCKIESLLCQAFSSAR
jgi:alcohol dehydrogenase class IV